MTKKEIIFGWHAVTAVLQQTPKRVAAIYLQQGRQDQRAEQLINIAQAYGIEPEYLPRLDLDELAGGTQHQGIVAECRTPHVYHEGDIEELLTQLNEPPFVLILDGVQDPHNLGACLRSANAAGVHLVIAPQDRAAGLTPAACKVASGAAEATPFIQVTNLARCIKLLKSLNIWVYGAAGEATKSIYATDLRGGLALVLGAEGKGLRHLTRELCDDLIYIPMQGSVDSLNVSVATGVCLFEAVRQRINKN